MAAVLVGSGMCEDCDLADQSPSLLLLLPVLLSLLWVLFQLFYAPWLLALLVTKLANLFLTDSGIYIGKWDTLAGHWPRVSITLQVLSISICYLVVWCSSTCITIVEITP